jgi:hypothetical protein
MPALITRCSNTLLTSDVGVLFGFWPQVSAVTAIGALPIAVWEFSLGVYLVVKGFKPSPITDEVTSADTRPQSGDESPRAGERG